LDEKGLDDGEGSIINIPLPARSGDTAFAAILERIISPAADRFKPEAILVSAGFDAHWRDPLASLQLTTRGFYTLGCGLKKLADALCESRIIYVLEGGYDPEALAENVQAILFSLTEEEYLGDPLGSPPQPDTDANAIIDEVIRNHSL
jgi:acetoin utilization deacetylase AcuC-like enzyme